MVVKREYKSGVRMIDFDREIIIMKSDDGLNIDESNFPPAISAGKKGDPMCGYHLRQLEEDILGPYCPFCLIERVKERIYHHIDD